MKNDLDLFLEELEFNRHASKNTCLSYGRDLRKFMEYLLARGINRWSRVAEKTIKFYLDYLYKQGRADSTVSRVVASFKTFFGYLYENAMIMENPAASCIPPKVKKNKPVVLSEDEMGRLLSMDFGDTPKGIRDHCMLLLMARTGIRVTELVALRMSDLDMENRILNIPGRSKNGVIEMDDELEKAFDRYLSLARPSFVSGSSEENDVLFTNYTGGSLSRQGFWKMLKGYTKDAELSYKVTPHTFTNYYRFSTNTK